MNSLTKSAPVLLGLLCAMLLPAPASAAPLEIEAPSAVAEAGTVAYATTVKGAAERVAFLVDGRRRWVSGSSRGRFRRSGFLNTADLGVGPHRLTVAVKRRGGRVLRAKHVLYVTRKGPGRVKKTEEPAPQPTTEPAPEQPTEPAPSPAPTEEPQPAPAPAPAPQLEPALLDAGFESGLLGWNIAGVGDAIPTLAGDFVRSGSRSGKVLLTGSQGRSELILGGDGGGSTTGMVQFHEGEEYWYGFAVNVRQMVYGRPGAHNLIMQFKSDGEGSPAFGLQLWDYAGDDGVSGGRGLWSHGEAMGGDRFLAPFSERTWHDIVLHFKASRKGAGFYELFLDGLRVDGRSGVSMIRPDRTYAYIKNGLYRNRTTLPGTSELRFDAARLGHTASSVGAS